MNNIYPLEKFYIYFSPYTAHALDIDGVIYPTIEHAYQCQRYDNPEIIEEIRKAPCPSKAREVSSKYKHLQLPDFKDRKLQVMKNLMQLKTEQHDEIKKALIESKDLQIVKHIVTYPPGDWFWDDGDDGKGLNHMGRMWMEIREELR